MIRIDNNYKKKTESNFKETRTFEKLYSDKDGYWVMVIMVIQYMQIKKLTS